MASFAQGYEVDFTCLLTDICNINIQGVSFGPQPAQSTHKTQGFLACAQRQKEKLQSLGYEDTV